MMLFKTRAIFARKLVLALLCAAAVQLAGDLAVVRVALDDVAQYVGGEGVDE